MRKTGLLLFLLMVPLGLAFSSSQYANAQLVLGPPNNLSATAVSTTQINLNWSPPSNLGTLLVTGYKIDRSTNGGSTWSTIVSNTGSSGTTYSNGGLQPSTTYTYRVSAMTLVLTSAPSNTASATTFTPVSPPSQPESLSASPGNSQVALSWSQPSSNGGAAITS